MQLIHSAHCYVSAAWWCTEWTAMNGNQRASPPKRSPPKRSPPYATLRSDWWKRQTAHCQSWLLRCCCDPVLALTNKSEVFPRLPAERFCSTKKRGDVAAAGPFCSGEWEGNVLFSGRDNVLTWQWLRRQPGLKDGSGLWQKRVPDVTSSRTATITRSLRGLRSTTS